MPEECVICGKEATCIDNGTKEALCDKDAKQLWGSSWSDATDPIEGDEDDRTQS
jgi:hypothetical protein